jgi:predicted ATP-grasp superfamily ATP-dependent carboligase
VSELKQAALKLRFPLIVKIRRGAGSKGVTRVDNKEQLKQVFEKTTKAFELNKDSLPIIQEYIEGDNYCVAALCKKGKVLSVSSYKSSHQYPIKHGTSTSRTSIKDKELESAAKKILEHLKWHGIAQFDIIKKGSQFFFLEMNPRLYTSLNLTVKAGLNYPYYLCKLDETSKIPDTYKVGVTARVIMMDSLCFLKDKKYNAKDFFRLKNSYFDDIILKDPLPTLPLIIKVFRNKLF